MLTARDAESEQVLGLGLGADDYVTKPFDPITFMARMRALYRRSQLSESSVEATEEKAMRTIWHPNRIYPNINSQTVKPSIRPINSTFNTKEFEILQLLPSSKTSIKTLTDNAMGRPILRGWAVDAHIKSYVKMEGMGLNLFKQSGSRL